MKKESRKAAADHRGITMIELLIGMSILIIVGMMISQLFGSAVRMYHSTIFYADVQTESQAVSRRLEDAVMNAGNLYMEDSEPGILLFTGDRRDEAGKKLYTGTVFWFNRDTGCLYQNSNFSMETDAESGLTVDAVKNAIENTASSGREYRISDKVKEMWFTISPELSIENKVPGTEDSYQLDQKVTVGFELTMQYLESGDYTIRSSATPRNRIGDLRWRVKP